MQTQLALLGGGPGGYAAAFLAADSGLDVTIVEAADRLGGTCLLHGCIPSKALLHVSRVLGEVSELENDWGVGFGKPQIQLDQLRSRKKTIIANLSGGLQQLAKRRKVNVIHARGVFENSTTLALEGEHASIPDDRRLTYEHVVLATGSVPAMPSMFDIGSDRVIDSTGALELRDIPDNMLIIGGGYIGLEMATVYAQLGTKVSLVELLDRLLPGADRDLVKPLFRKLQGLLGNRIYLDTQVGSLGKVGSEIEVAFDGPGKFGAERFDKVLVSVGRRPNSGGIGLENTSVEIDQRGFVVCDSKQRTADPHILAIGDVAGEPMLAHKAAHEGRVAIQALMGEPAEFDKLAIPAVVFTDPEIAWAGLTEEDAKRNEREHEVVIYPWAASGRAHSLGRTEGLTKWIVAPESQRLLGCGITGPGAGELIAEAVLAIEMGCEVRDVAESIHPHPTLSETLMNAGEVFFGTATEIYKPRSS